MTSTIIGNCGVTFAPCRPEDRRYLAEMMESVEDIPAEAILDSLSWKWETYSQYLSDLDRLPKGLNVGGMIGHSALRRYAMGDRAEDVDATDADLAVMSDLIDDAMKAGAFGFSSSRTLLHTGADGRPIPGTFAGRDELLALTATLGRHGRGVFETAAMVGSQNEATDDSTGDEIRLFGDISRASGRPVTFGLTHTFAADNMHRLVLDLVAGENANGAQVRPQTTVRSVGVLFGLANHTPYGGVPSWQALGERPFAERLAAVRDRDQRARLASDVNEHTGGIDPALLFPIDRAPADYSLDADRSLAAMAGRAGTTPVELWLDLLDRTDGGCLLNWPFLNQSPAAVGELLADPNVVLGLADAGAHVGQIMDASQPTWFLSHWVRDRELCSLEEGVARLTSIPARLFGIADRGVLVEGAPADLNVLDLAALSLPVPEFAHDFPRGAGRWVQGGVGYDLTVVNGEITVEGGAAHRSPSRALDASGLSSVFGPRCPTALLYKNPSKCQHRALVHAAVHRPSLAVSRKEG